MQIKLRIKYCGGCNPIINRSRLVQEVISLLKETEDVEVVSKDADVGLLVAGCSVCCVDRSEIEDQAKAWITISGSLLDYVQIATDLLPGAVSARVLVLRKSRNANH